MKKLFGLATTGLIAGAALLLTMAPAIAGGPQVDWSVNIGSPGYYPPAVVYAPQAVYVNPVPVIQYAAPAYVYGRGWDDRDYWRHRHHGRRHHGGHHRHDD